MKVFFHMTAGLLGLTCVGLGLTLSLLRSAPSNATWLISDSGDFNPSSQLYAQKDPFSPRRPLRGVHLGDYFRYWGRDGRIYFMRRSFDQDPDSLCDCLYRVSFYGQKADLVLQRPASPNFNFEGDFYFSPDEKYIAYSVRRGRFRSALAIARADGSGGRMLFEQNDESVYRIMWGADGEWVYFYTRQRPAQNEFYLYRASMEQEGWQALGQGRGDAETAAERLFSLSGYKTYTRYANVTFPAERPKRHVKYFYTPIIDLPWRGWVPSLVGLILLGLSLFIIRPRPL